MIDQGAEFDAFGNVAAVADEVDGAFERVDSIPEARGQNAGLEVFYDVGWYMVEGAVDTGTPGTYQVKVTASDKHGNVATKEYSVTVNEIAPPVVEEPAVEEAAVEAAAAAAAAAAPAPEPATFTYILNTNTHKFHVPGCSSVAKMKEKNKQVIEATRDEVIAMGYSPCGNCRP